MQKKILIIEDNQSYREILSKKFTHEDFDVYNAENGHDGINKAIDNKPDILITDLLLPKMNGIQVMGESRNNEWGRHVTILILTNLNPDDKILESIERNKPAYYLIKPQVTLEDIVEKVKSVLQSSQESTE